MSSIAQFYAVKEAIRDANPIDEVISETMSLRRQGRRLVGAHYAHDSQSGTSLHVDSDRGLYICRSCGEGGDVFSWIMALRRCSFPEALRILADRAHIPLPEWTEEERAHQQRLWEERQVLKPLYLAATAFYCSQLTPEIETWCLEKWGLRSETLSRLRIGFAPVNPTALWDHLLEQGFTRELLPKSGLFVKVRSSFVDFYQGRIIFPYWTTLPLDTQGGEVVYFIG